MALGLIGRKVAMTQLFTDTGEVVPVTVLRVGPCVVVQAKTEVRDGYAAVQLGFEPQKPQRVSKAYRNHCLRSGKGVFRVLREFRLEEEPVQELAPGKEIAVGDVFAAGALVDVTGWSKGRGFAGVVKRHGFGGFPASHGTHEYFRHGGAIGNRSFPGRVFKGKRMAGRFGNERVTVQNLRVVAVRPEEHLLLVEGAVPGWRNGLVLVRPARKGRKERGDG